MQEKFLYFINKQLHDVKVERTNNQNIYLKVINGAIVCRAPHRIAPQVLKQFVDQHIHKMLQYVAEVKQNQLYSLIEDYLYWGGQKYFFKRLSGFAKANLVLTQQQCYIHTKTSRDDEVEKALKQALKKRLMPLLKRLQAHYQEVMQIAPHTLQVVYKTATWGSNYPQQRKIIYSARLAHFQTNVIAYLVVHELAHALEKNHSRQFWNIVRQFCPEYQKYDLELHPNQQLKIED